MTETPLPFRDKTGHAPCSQLELDLSWVRKLVQNLQCKVDLEESVFPTSATGPTPALQELFTALMIKRLFRVLVRAHEAVPSERLRVLFSSCGQVLPLVSIPRLCAWVRSPDVTAWVFQMEERIGQNHLQGIEETGSLLSNPFLDLLLAEGIECAPQGLEAAWTGSVMVLPETGILLRRPAAEAPTSRLQVEGGVIRFLGPPGSGRPPSLHHGMGKVQALQGMEAEELTRIRSSPIRLLHRTPIIQALYPTDGNGRAHALAARFECATEEAYATALGDGLVLLEHLWPELHRDVCAFVTAAVPVEDDQGWRPNNQSVHAFRGLVATSPRPSYFAAQMWAHESGHTKFSTILDLFSLVEPEATALLLPSPFVGIRRPWYAVLHGLFSFARDLEITRRMIGVVPDFPGFPMDRYFRKNLDKWTEALALVRTSLPFTVHGRSLMTAFDRIEKSILSP
jgi:HEXXH motif-containing protein